MILVHNCFLFILIIMKLRTQTLHESRMCPMDFWGQRSRSQCIYNWKWCMPHNYFAFTPIIMRLDTKTRHESRMCPMDFRIQGQGHNALITENSICRIIAFLLLLSSWNFIQRLPMRLGCALLISGSRGQGHNIDNWKWFMLHNCFPFTPVKRSKVTMQWLLKIVYGA